MELDQGLPLAAAGSSPQGASAPAVAMGQGSSAGQLSPDMGLGESGVQSDSTADSPVSAADDPRSKEPIAICSVARQGVRLHSTVVHLGC